MADQASLTPPREPHLPVPWFEEPFRLFFPLGLAVALAGLAIWPLWIAWPETFRYPLIAHQALMIQGMVGAFALGFLGTAGPRMLSAPPMARWEVVLAIGILTAAMAAHLSGFPAAGHFLFASTLGWWLFALVRRWPTRRDLPPPGFPLVLFGLLAALTGALLSGFVSAAVVSPQWMGSAKFLLETLFPLGLILGVGPFLLPRFFKQPAPHYFDTMLRPDSGWLRELYLALIPLTLLIAAALSHLTGQSTLASWLAFAALVVYFGLRFPIFSGQLRMPALPWLLRMSFVSSAIGLGGEALAPGKFGAGWPHLFFIGGVFTLILAVSCRVIWGHAGEQFRFTQKSIRLRFIVAAIGCALAMRLLAEVSFESRAPLLALSALCLCSAVLVWSALVGPALLRVDPD